MSRAALFLESAYCPLPTVAKRFLAFPFAAQWSILHALRWTAFPEGIFLQVPASEWLRLLCLVDPVIRAHDGPVDTYQLEEGRGVLMLLLSHYLDVR